MYQEFEMYKFTDVVLKHVKCYFVMLDNSGQMFQRVTFHQNQFIEPEIKILTK